MDRNYIKNTIQNLSIKGKWYQGIEIQGIKVPLSKNPIKSEKKYNNACQGKGKWDNFIKPLIPFKNVKNKTFVELGCNAGLFLILAKKMGFKTVIGIEPNTICFKQSQFVKKAYSEINPIYKSIKLLNKKVGTCTYDNKHDNECETLSIDNIPTADITLLANVLYWIPMESIKKYVKNILRKKTRYVIVIGLKKGARPKISPSSFIDLKLYFEEKWKLIKSISLEDIQIKKNQKTRDIISMLFKSQLSPSKGF